MIHFFEKIRHYEFCIRGRNLEITRLNYGNTRYRLKSQSQKIEFGVWTATNRHHIYHIKLLEIDLSGSKIGSG